MSIRKKLILTLLVIAVVPMVFVGTLGYYSAKQALENAKISALTGICDLKVKKIEAFIADGKKEIATLQAHPGVSSAIGILAQNPPGAPDQAGILELNTLLNRLQEAYHFTNAVVASADGQINYVMAGGDSAEYERQYLPNRETEPKEALSDDIRISDVYFSGHPHRPMAIMLTAPIFRPDNKVAGWLCLEYDISPIFESIQDTTGLGRTGETLMAKRVGQSALFLNPLRHDPGAARKRKIEFGDMHGLPIQSALSGKNGHGLSVDYRGRPVIAAWRHIPSLGWGMVAKMDSAEAFEPITRLRNFALLLIIAVVLLSICSATIAARSFSRPIHALQKGVEEIGKGNLDHKVGTLAKDEIGQLGMAFDQMVEKLKAVTASRDVLNLEIRQRRRAEEDLRRTINALDETVRELNCLFEISRLVERHSQSAEKIFQGTVDLIPGALKHPDIACAKIALNGQAFKTENFKVSAAQHACGIEANGITVGNLVVGYLEKPPPQAQTPFTSEEIELLNVIAERLGKIIERRNSQDALKRSEKRFRDLVENSLAGISIIQANQVIYQNKEQERLLGPIPRPYLLADFERIHPDDVDKVKGMLEKLEGNRVQTIETEFRYYSSRKRYDARDMKWVSCRSISIEFNGQKAFLVNLVDMTRAKELEKLVTMQDKMASLGRVAAGIAHEIRNPLSGINIYMDTLKKLHHKEGTEEKVDNIIRQINAASRKIEAVIRRVMDFARPSEPRLTLVDINEPISEALNLTAVALRKSAVLLIKSLASDLPAIYADRHLIEEMVLNLINNAADAMRPQRTDKIIEVSSTLEKDGIRVTVSDSGPGIPLEIRDKIFDPYLTTKSEGTGIGLSLCHRIVTDHGGSLTVGDSELGGAEFRATIPIRKGR